MVDRCHWAVAWPQTYLGVFPDLYYQLVQYYNWILHFDWPRDQIVWFESQLVTKESSVANQFFLSHAKVACNNIFCMLSLQVCFDRPCILTTANQEGDIAIQFEYCLVAHQSMFINFLTLFCALLTWLQTIVALWLVSDSLQITQYARPLTQITVWIWPWAVKKTRYRPL